MRLFLSLAFAICVAGGCAGGSSSGGDSQTSVVTVSVSPASASLRAGDTQQFNASVTGSSVTGISWLVNGVLGGNATVGTITATGLYTAPNVVPNPNNVAIEARSSAAAGAAGTSTATLLNPIPVVTNLNPTAIGVGQITLNVVGAKFAIGAVINFGSTVVPATFISSGQLGATLTVTNSHVGTVAVTVRNPDPGGVTSGALNAQVTNAQVVSATAAARFLEQATFGPTSQLLTQVQQVGLNNFLQDQFAAPSAGFDDAQPDAQGDFNNAGTLQRRWFTNALFGPDQLRQRVAFALHKIWVVSWVNVNDSRAFVSYLRMHQNHAFGNYRQIMENVSKNPAMGRYQDIANNDGAPNRAGNCNENYGRELMQLFTIGLWKLNLDGTFQRDAQSGDPIPAYDPVAVVEQNACALTGWTYQKETPATRDWPRPPFYLAPLEAVETHHESLFPKTLIDGFVAPAGGTAQRDLTLTLDNIFCHPNLPPFVARLMIQQLVTSNPSPAYVQRVASVWTGGGACTPGQILPPQRGDMRALISAILLDPEARRGDTLSPDDPALVNDGKLKEPILLITNVFRALGAQSDGNLASLGSPMGQTLLFPPTVFSYFSPDYQIPGSSLFAPEINIQNTSTAFARINFVNTTAFSSRAGTTISWAPLTALAANPSQLLDNLNVLLLHGSLSDATRSSILTAVNAVPAGASQNEQRARTAFYLIASSSQYQVQR